MVLGARTIDRTVPFYTGYYPNTKRNLELNILYISNLIALRRWYREVRCHFFRDGLRPLLLEGAIRCIEGGIKERIKRLDEVISRIPESNKIELKLTGKLDTLKENIHKMWPEIRDYLNSFEDVEGHVEILEKFGQVLSKVQTNDYLNFVKSLSESEKETGTEYLDSIVRTVMEKIFTRYLNLKTSVTK
jgi:UDP-N-acetylglucosamine/UDP-N-acetylgalactosamine diphosphorylase